MTPRTFGRKVAFGFAVFSFFSMVVSVAFLIYFMITRGSGDVATASLFATTLFFFSCGVVLYLMSKPPLHKLLPWDHPETDEK